MISIPPQESMPFDAFGGDTYRQVLQSERLSAVQNERMFSGRTLESVSAMPATIPEGFSPDRRLVQLPVFPNSLERRSWSRNGITRVPNQIAFRALAIAEQTGLQVSAFGQPYGYNHAERAKATYGDFSDYAADVVDRLRREGVTSTIVYGFSEGGSFAPDVALALLEAGIDVEAVIIGATPNADDQRGTLKLVQNFIDMKALKEIQQAQEVSPALKESAFGRTLGNHALNLAKVVAVDTLGMLASIGSKMVRPTSIAFGRGFAYGKWFSKAQENGAHENAIEEKIRSIIERKPDIVFSFFTAENDKIGSPAMMKKMMERSGFNAEELTIFEGLGHSVGDNITATAAYLGAVVRQLDETRQA